MNNAYSKCRINLKKASRCIVGLRVSNIYSSLILDESNIDYGMLLEKSGTSCNIKYIEKGSADDTVIGTVNQGNEFSIRFEGNQIRLYINTTIIKSFTYDQRNHFYPTISFQKFDGTGGSSYPNNGKLADVKYHPDPYSNLTVTGITYDTKITTENNLLTNDDLDNLRAPASNKSFRFTTDVMKSLARILGFRHNLYESKQLTKGEIRADVELHNSFLPNQILVTTTSVSLDCFDGKLNKRRNILLNLPFDDTKVQENAQDTSISYQASFPVLLKVNTLNDTTLREIHILLYNREEILKLVDEDYSCELNLLIQDP